MGTTIFVAEPPPDDPDGEFEEWLDPEDTDLTPFIPPALTRFHFARRFWNQILTWASVNLNAWAICERSPEKQYAYLIIICLAFLYLSLIRILLGTPEGCYLLPRLKYFFSWNSLSREISCSLENAVLLLRAAAAAAAADVESFLILTPPLAMHWPSMFGIWLVISSDSSSLLCIARCFLTYTSRKCQKRS